jgi:uncharacterized protein (DUF488 family)
MTGLNRAIFTLGTGTRTRAEFISLLERLEVKVVVDVRRFPTSRFEHFKKEKLAKSLSEAGVRYCDLGAELGGYRKEGYRNFMTSGEFLCGLEKLKNIAQARKTTIICAEKLPWRCHRRFIAEELEKQDWSVTHVIDEEHNWTPKTKSSEPALVKHA